MARTWVKDRDEQYMVEVVAEMEVRIHGEWIYGLPDTTTAWRTATFVPYDEDVVERVTTRAEYGPYGTTGTAMSVAGLKKPRTFHGKVRSEVVTSTTTYLKKAKIVWETVRIKTEP